MKPIAIFAVAALAATAISFEAEAYCRGCAVGTGVATGVIAGAVAIEAIQRGQDANAATAPSLPPGTPPADLDAHRAYDSAVCHVERRQVTDGSGSRRWTNTEICD